MARSTTTDAHTTPFATLRTAWSGFLEILTETSVCIRCAREAERLSQLSDEKLARRGLKRNEIFDHAFLIRRGL